MKRKFVILIVILCSSQSGRAILVSLFVDTDTYIERAEDIVIAECISIPEQVFVNGRLVEVNIKTVLKGDKQPGKFNVYTIYPTEVGRNYLLMNMGGETQGTDFLAISELAVVTIPDFFDFDKLKGKNLKEQLHFIFLNRLHAVQRKLDPLLKEKELLDKALKDRTDNLYESAEPVEIGEIRTTYAKDYHKGEVTYLKLNNRQMEWSKGSTKSGYLYFQDPNTNLPVWEFAPLEYAKFTELKQKKLKVRFSGMYTPLSGQCITVREGQMVLARHKDEPLTIYVMKFDRQEDNKVFISYAIIKDNQKLNSDALYKSPKVSR